MTDVKTNITDNLEAIAKHHGFQVLFASDSGSRAYGLQSSTSDYDVRFLFKSSLRKYMSLGGETTTIDNKLELFDVVGWDIKKAFHLAFMENNPTLLEWVLSPQYMNILSAKHEDRLLDLLVKPDYRSHYSGMAYNHFKKALDTNTATAQRVKVLLYALRSLLMLDYLEANQVGGWKPFPMDFETLVDYFEMPDAQRQMISELVSMKRGLIGLENADKLINEVLTVYTPVMDNRGKVKSVNTSKSVHDDASKLMFDIISA